MLLCCLALFAVIKIRAIHNSLPIINNTKQSIYIVFQLSGASDTHHKYTFHGLLPYPKSSKGTSHPILFLFLAYSFPLFFRFLILIISGSLVTEAGYLISHLHISMLSYYIRSIGLNLFKALIFLLPLWQSLIFLAKSLMLDSAEWINFHQKRIF